MDILIVAFSAFVAGVVFQAWRTSRALGCSLIEVIKTGGGPGEERAMAKTGGGPGEERDPPPPPIGN